MQKLAHFYGAAPTQPNAYQTRLIEEIAYLEARLHDIGITGDCAYEKALARSYDLLLKDRRRQLATEGILEPRPR